MGREDDELSNGKLGFPLIFKTLLRENSSNPAALSLPAASQGTDNFGIAQVFGVSCGLGDISRALVGA